MRPQPSQASWWLASHLTRKVGAERTAEQCFPTPPSEPCMRLSPHTALRGWATSRSESAVIGCSFVEAARFTSDTKDSQGDLRLLVGRTSIPWRPSPCRRLSRPLSTMTPPTLAYFIDGLLISICEPPTFIPIRSTRWCRQRLCVTSPALRGIPNGYGVNQVTHIILWAGKVR
jgi:hypothetical protein